MSSFVQCREIALLWETLFINIVKIKYKAKKLKKKLDEGHQLSLRLLVWGVNSTTSFGYSGKHCTLNIIHTKRKAQDFLKN